MKNKMNLDVVAENEEEKRIEDFLNVLHKSSEVQQFLDLMREEAKRRNVFKYRARIKNANSAIRTYRINKKTLDNAHDYIGISFITHNEKEIYPIIDFLKQKLSSAEFIDFVSEEMIYSPLVYIKWVPPLGYNVLAKESLIPNQREVPIEIRVCSKEGFISEQAAYYSIQKNDSIKMPIEEKNNLRNIVQHIAYKLAILSIRELTEEERIKHERELNAVIYNNKEFLHKNKELCKEAILDLGRLIYRCENDREMEIDELNLDEVEVDKIDEYLKVKFGILLDDKRSSVIDTVCEAIKKIKLLSYKEVKQALKNE